MIHDLNYSVVYVLEKMLNCHFQTEKTTALVIKYLKTLNVSMQY